MTANNLQVVLIGSGNVASALADALTRAGASIIQVYDRNIAKAKKLGQQYGAKAIDQLSSITRQPAFVIIAVKDDAIAGIAKEIKIKEGIVVHTSGAVPMNVLKKFSQHGIFYPLQTFTAGRKISFENVPVCLEAGDYETLFSLSNIAESISSQVYHLDSKQREAVHLAAVFANNFTNSMYVIAEEIAEQNNLPFDILRPLISETAEKIKMLSPSQTQTGPAARADMRVIKKQLSLFKKHPGLKKIYVSVTNEILARGKKKK